MITKKFLKTKDVCEVTFEYANESAAEVALVGDFNDWQPLTMKQAKKAGSPFRIKARMPKNADYQFRYYVDRAYWANDDRADTYWPNKFGEDNSVVNTYE
jgi:1,4-alpha-glucan branching enzyme